VRWIARTPFGRNAREKFTMARNGQKKGPDEPALQIIFAY
jgi:hypothetical protein